MKPDPRIKAIAAMSENRVIGGNNAIPWHLPEDFKWFKKMTVGKIVVMGRKTFESIGKPLPGRQTVVLSRGSFSYPGVEVRHEIDEVWQLPGSEEIFICGGAEIYRQALPSCSELFLTVVKRVVPGDTFFPPFEQWFEAKEIIKETPEFRITRWVRTSATSLT